MNLDDIAMLSIEFRFKTIFACERKTHQELIHHRDCMRGASSKDVEETFVKPKFYAKVNNDFVEAHFRLEE